MNKLLISFVVVLLAGASFLFSVGCNAADKSVDTSGDERGHQAEWMTDFEVAKKLAGERKVPILADFSGSDWCGWCMKLDREVFSKKEFQDYAKDNMILFLADFPSQKTQTEEVKKQNAQLQEKYGIQGFPTVLILDASGNVLARTGYVPGGAVKYVDHIQSLLKSGK